MDCWVPLDSLARDTAPPEVRRLLALYEGCRGPAGAVPEAASVAASLGGRAASLRVVEPGEAALLRAFPGAAHPLLVLGAGPDAPGSRGWDRLVLPCRHGGEPRFLAVEPRRDETDVLRAVLEASSNGILAVRALRDEVGRVVDALVLTANRRACAFLGHPWEMLADGSLLDLMPCFREPGTWARIGRVIERRVLERFDIQRDMDGLDTWLQVTLTPLDDGVMLSISDVTALKYALFEMEVMKEQAERAREELASEVAARRLVEGELRRIAVTDGLTGVLNRRGFDEIVRTMTATARRYGHPLSVIAIDIDHFKRVNDAHGHAAGDAVLVRVAMMVGTEIRDDSDAVSRMGGEEFMVLLPHTDAAGAAIVAERLRLRIQDTPIVVGETAIRVSASFGVRELPENGDAERMLIEADAALYQAKQAGRNCVVTSAGEANAPALEAAQKRRERRVA